MVKIKTDKTTVDLLTAKQAQAEHARLTAEIGGHDKRYYQDDRPSITDAEYDALRQRYNAIETRFPDLRTQDSRSVKVGAAPSAKFKKVQHAVPMLSLDNALDARFPCRAEERRPVDVAALRGWRTRHRCAARRRR